MEFDSNKPIYLQICDSIEERILRGELKSGDHIPSVREMGSDIGVNPNTVARSFEKLTDLGVIHTRRGLGYFVSDDAAENVLRDARKSFLEVEVPAFVHRMELLGLTINDIIK